MKKRVVQIKCPHCESNFYRAKEILKLHKRVRCPKCQLDVILDKENYAMPTGNIIRTGISAIPTLLASLGLARLVTEQEKRQDAIKDLELEPDTLPDDFYDYPGSEEYALADFVRRASVMGRRRGRQLMQQGRQWWHRPGERDIREGISGVGKLARGMSRNAYRGLKTTAGKAALVGAGGYLLGRRAERNTQQAPQMGYYSFWKKPHKAQIDWDSPEGKHLEKAMGVARAAALLRKQGKKVTFAPQWQRAGYYAFDAAAIKKAAITVGQGTKRLGIDALKGGARAALGALATWALFNIIENATQVARRHSNTVGPYIPKIERTPEYRNFMQPQQALKYEMDILEESCRALPYCDDSATLQYYKKVAQQFAMTHGMNDTLKKIPLSILLGALLNELAGRGLLGAVHTLGVPKTTPPIIVMQPTPTAVKEHYAKPTYLKRGTDPTKRLEQMLGGQRRTTAEHVQAIQGAQKPTLPANTRINWTRSARRPVQGSHIVHPAREAAQNTRALQVRKTTRQAWKRLPVLPASSATVSSRPMAKIKSHLQPSMQRGATMLGLGAIAAGTLIRHHRAKKRQQQLAREHYGLWSGIKRTGRVLQTVGWPLLLGASALGEADAWRLRQAQRKALRKQNAKASEVLNRIKRATSGAFYSNGNLPPVQYFAGPALARVVKPVIKRGTRILGGTLKHLGRAIKREPLTSAIVGIEGASLLKKEPVIVNNRMPQYYAKWLPVNLGSLFRAGSITKRNLPIKSLKPLLHKLPIVQRKQVVANFLERQGIKTPKITLGMTKQNPLNVTDMPGVVRDAQRHVDQLRTAAAGWAPEQQPHKILRNAADAVEHTATDLELINKAFLKSRQRGKFGTGIGVAAGAAGGAAPFLLDEDRKRERALRKRILEAVEDTNNG